MTVCFDLTAFRSVCLSLEKQELTERRYSEGTKNLSPLMVSG